MYDESLGTSYSIWSGSYHGIANANTLIGVLADPGTPVSDGIRKRVTGEAKFFRAHRYFLLVTLFGDIPLVLKSGANAGIGAERADVHTVYARIVDDLKSAAENLNEYKVPGDYSTEEQGRVTRQSAYGLLAKVYLYWAQTDGATDVKGKLDSSVYYADQAKKVCLHSTMFLGRKTSAMVATICLTVLFFITYSDSLTPHTVVSDRTFYDRFDDRDQRKKGSFIADMEVPKDQVSSYGTHVYFKLPRFQKYVDPGSPQTSAYNRELNASILRYADILLVKAEAINERD